MAFTLKYVAPLPVASPQKVDSDLPQKVDSDYGLALKVDSDECPDGATNDNYSGYICI